MTKDWLHPPLIKVYEAYGAIADKRVEMSPYGAKVFSSTKRKCYTVTWDGTNYIMCNDDSSYEQGFLGYPAIAFLCLKGVLPFSASAALALRGIAWKEINTKHKNDYRKTLMEVELLVREKGIDFSAVAGDVEATYSAMGLSAFKQLGEKQKPPEGF